MKRNGTFWGLMLIVIGTLVFLNRMFNFAELNISNLWPLFVIVPGLSFEIGYFSNKKDPGVLVPGGILTTIGLLFFFETFSHWNYSAYTWPIYPLAVAIGLFQLYIHGHRSNGLLIPIFILTATALISFITMVYGNIYSWANFDFIMPVLVILLGIVILIGSFVKKR